MGNDGELHLHVFAHVKGRRFTNCYMNVKESLICTALLGPTLTQNFLFMEFPTIGEILLVFCFDKSCD